MRWSPQTSSLAPYIKGSANDEAIACGKMLNVPQLPLQRSNGIDASWSLSSTAGQDECH